MKKLIAIISALSFASFSYASESYTIYLVRHAEKVKEVKNPPLTECGKVRAKQLATILKQANIEQVYSTSYNRTMATATPIANNNKLAIKNYAPNRLAQFAQKLKQERVNTLVVGHSNTTPQLAQLISDMEVAEISELEYQMLYQIQVTGDHKELVILRQPLTCQ